VIRSSGAGDFDGDPVFVKDSQASQYFSQRRSGIACYYEWWSAKSGPDQSTALSREADLAHRQAVSLSPYNPVVAWRYTEYLLRNRRTNDATLLVNMVLKVDPEKRMDVDSDQLKMSLKKLREEAKRLSLEGNTR
jgi:hypothetical protein